MDYMVVVVTVQQRFVTADDPIDAIRDALNYRGEVNDEQWERDEKIERVHVFIDDEEHRVIITKKVLAQINKKQKEFMDRKDSIRDDSWNDIMKADIKKLPTISLEEVARIEFQTL